MTRLRAFVGFILVVLFLSCYKHPAPSTSTTKLGAMTPAVSIYPTIASLTGLRGQDGLSVYVASVRAPWHYCASCAALTVDHITVEATADGGNTRWVRDALSSPVWSAQAAWYIDPVAGSDEASGADSGHQIKTLAEWNRRTGLPWVIPADRDIYFSSYPPNTDPLRLRLKFYQNPSGAGPTLTFHPPAFVTASTGTFSAVTAHAQGTNIPWSVTDGVVITTGDVTKRIRITAGPRASARTWVAKSTGAGQRRTGTWANWAANSLPTIITPQVNDPYIVEASAGFLYVDDITIEPGAANVYLNSCAVVMTGLDLHPTITNATTSIRNQGCTMWLTDVGFWNGEWQIRTGAMTGDSSGMSTWLQNCATFNGQNNMMFHEGTFTEHFVYGGVYGGALWPRTGAGVTIDYDVLSQNGLGGVPGLFVQSGGALNIASAGVMDQHANFGALLVGDGVAGISSGSSFSGNVALWGTSANAGTTGADVRAGGTVRVEPGALMTITGVVGDFKVAGATSGWTFNESTAVFTSNACTWTGLSTNGNIQNFASNARAYMNPSGSSQAQP